MFIVSMYSLLPLVGAIFTFALGFFVWSKNYKTPLSILFFLYSSAIAFWLFGTFQLFNAVTDEAALFWDRSIYLGVALIPIFLYHFGLVYSKIKNQQWVLYLGYVLAVFFFSIAHTDYLVADLFRYAWGVHAQAQTLHHFFLLYFFAYFILFFVNLFRSYQKAEGEQKAQIKYLLIGFFILDFIGPFAFLPAYNISIYPVVFLSAIPFVLLVAYAMVKYHALDVKVLSVEVFSALVTILFTWELFLSESIEETMMRTVALAGVLFFVLMLLKSVRSEVRKREQIEQLNKDLNKTTKKLKVQNKKLEESKQREIEKAKDLMKLKDEFVFVAAHELKAPVSAINGFLELTKVKHEKVSKTMQKNLDSIAQASKHLHTLVGDLLQVARNDAGVMNADLAAISLKEMFGHIFDEQTVLAKKRGIDIQSDVADLVVSADQNKLKEVLTNLVNNAIKYNKENGTIFITVKKKGKRAIVAVRDTGHGIPESEQKKIFQKFFRAGGKATEGVLGTGLGLFITKMLVEKMGGTITFDSVEGKGTTFTVDLAIAKKTNNKKSA